MKMAIIGAGEGSRLRQEGVSVSKPLVRINGVPMVERIVRIAARNGIESLHIIIHEAFGEVRDHLDSLDVGIPVSCRLLSTPSSMHTLFALAPDMKSSPFCLSTVDTVFREIEFSRFLEFCNAAQDVQGVLAVSDFIDDENPLCVTLDAQDRITGFHDSRQGCRFATGGVYFFSPLIFSEMEHALENGISRLRNFLRLLLHRGYVLKAFPFSKMVDVDHLSDIREAERFLATEAE